MLLARLLLSMLLLLLLLFWLGFLLWLIGGLFLGFLFRPGRLFLLLRFLLLVLASHNRHAKSQEQKQCCRTDSSN